MAIIPRQRMPRLLAALAAGFLLLPACNPWRNSTQSATLFRIVSVTGKDLANQDQNFALSDVLYQDPQNGRPSPGSPTWGATFSAELLDPKVHHRVLRL